MNDYANLPAMGQATEHTCQVDGTGRTPAQRTDSCPRCQELRELAAAR